MAIRTRHRGSGRNRALTWTAFGHREVLAGESWKLQFAWMMSVIDDVFSPTEATGMQVLANERAYPE
jgi:hypothetical protein